MREKLSTRESLAVYAILIALTLGVFLFGLHIGMTQAGKTSESGQLGSDGGSPDGKPRAKVDFFEQVNRPRPTRQPAPSQTPSAETATAGEPDAAKRSPDVLVASGTDPAKPAFAAAQSPKDPNKGATQADVGSTPAAPAASVPKSTPPAPVTTPVPREESGQAGAVPGEAFTIQIGAVTSEQDAKQLIVRLQARGYTGILDRPSGADRFYRVRVGSYADRASASRAERLLKEEGFSTYIKKIQTGGSPR